MAVVNGEPEGDRMTLVMAAHPCRISVGTWLEVSIVADGRSPAHGERLDHLLEEFRVERVPMTDQQAKVARIAYRRYGKGSGSPARLNLGDCFAYALSSTSGEPLLFTGDDFTHTDVLRVVER
jgi:ribonuclease VapC